MGSECRTHVGGCFASGYGNVWREGKAQRAHRVAWADARGPIPEGQHVLHTCDNPACVNVDHLFLGSHADNMRDKKEKGRAPGLTRENHPMTKISEPVAKRIAKEYTGAYGEIVRLATFYGVTRKTVRNIIRQYGGVDGWAVM